jgi:hypothetical protein
MRKGGIDCLRERIARFAERAQKKAGPGFSYEAVLPDGSAQHYRYTNLREVDLIADDVASWCLWLWSLKDYVRHAGERAGKSGNWWKEVVHASEALQFCADLANREKHETLDHEWTSLGLRFGPVAFRIPQSAIGMLAILPDSVLIDTADPEQVDYAVPLLDSSGQEVGDAFTMLWEATDAWERALSELGDTA